MAARVEDQGARGVAAVTPSDTVNLPGVSRALWVGGAGDLSIVAENDETAVTLSGVAAGTVIPVRTRRVNATNTTATLIAAMYSGSAPSEGVGGTYLISAGDTILDWNALSPSFSGSTASKQSSNTYSGQASALRLTNTSNPVADVTGLSLDFTDFKNLIVPIYRAPGTGRTVVSVFFGKGGYTTFLAFYIVVDDVGWAEYSIGPDAYESNGGAALDSGYDRARVRLQDNVNSYSYAAGAGNVDVGNIRRNMITRPKVMFTVDDNRNVLRSNPVSGKTIESILAARGFVGTAYLIARSIGESGFETAISLQELKAAGWALANHTYLHPISGDNQGLKLLGPTGFASKAVSSVDTTADTITASAVHNIPTNSSLGYYYAVEFAGTDLPSPLVTGTAYYPRQTSTTAFTLHPTWQDSVANTNRIDLTTTGTAANFTFRFAGSANDHTAIQSDLQAAMTALLAIGISDDETKHLALPQGAYDPNIVTACENLGIKTVRGIHNVGRNPGANTAGLIGPTNPRYSSRRINLAGTRQVDAGSPTLAELQTYVDNAILWGTSITFLVHTLDATIVTKLEGIADYVRTKVDAGLIDCVTVPQWWAGFASARAARNIV